MKARALRAGAAFALLALGSLAACTSETIVLATVPLDDGGGGGGVHPSTRCAQPSDCNGGSFCDKAACDDPVGTCRLFPADCDGPQSTVCGCDGISYFNDCLRRAAGVAAATGGECSFSEAQVCSTTADCPTGAACAHLIGFVHDGACARDVPGVCWVIPPTCPTSTSSNYWNACDGSARCSSTCDAIRAGGTHARAQSCP